MRGRRRKGRERQRGRDWLLGADDFSTLKREMCTLDGFRFLLPFSLVFPSFSVLDFFSLAQANSLDSCINLVSVVSLLSADLILLSCHYSRYCLLYHRYYLIIYYIGIFQH